MKEILVIDKKKHYFRLLKRTHNNEFEFLNYFTINRDNKKEYSLCFLVIYSVEDISFLYDNKIKSKKIILLYENKKNPYLRNLIILNITLINIDSTKNEYMPKIKELLYSD